MLDLDPPVASGKVRVQLRLVSWVGADRRLVAGYVVDVDWIAAPSGEIRTEIGPARLVARVVPPELPA